MLEKIKLKDCPQFFAKEDSLRVGDVVVISKYEKRVLEKYKHTFIKKPLIHYLCEVKKVNQETFTLIITEKYDHESKELEKVCIRLRIKKNSEYVYLVSRLSNAERFIGTT